MGRKMAAAFVKEGARATVAADIQEQPREGATTVELVEQSGGRAVFVKTESPTPTRSPLPYPPRSGRWAGHILGMSAPGATSEWVNGQARILRA